MNTPELLRSNNTNTGLPEFTNDGNKVANADHTYIVGSSCRGKSVIIKEMYDKIYKKDKKLIILIISPSLNTPTFKKIKADNIIRINKYNKQTEQLIKKIIAVQIEADLPYRFLIIIDDVTDAYHSGVLNNLFLVNRNQQISTILSVQYPLILSKRARSSAKNIIAGGLNSAECIEVMLSSFLNNELLKKMKEDTEYLKSQNITDNKKIKKNELVDYYRYITDGNDGHVFFYYNPQQRKLETFTLKL